MAADSRLRRHNDGGGQGAVRQLSAPLLRNHSFPLCQSGVAGRAVAWQKLPESRQAGTPKAAGLWVSRTNREKSIPDTDQSPEILPDSGPGMLLQTPEHMLSLIALWVFTPEQEQNISTQLMCGRDYNCMSKIAMFLENCH